MGVSISHYVMFGIKVPYIKCTDKNEDIFYNKYYSDKIDNLVAVHYGMDSEFTFIGKLLAIGDECEGLPIVTFNPDSKKIYVDGKEIYVDKYKVTEEIGKFFDDMNLPVPNEIYDLNFMVFTNYS